MKRIALFAALIVAVATLTGCGSSFAGQGTAKATTKATTKSTSK